MRKIGIVTEYFYPHLGGITEHVYHFSREMIARGYEVVVLTGYEGETTDVDLPPSLRIIRLGRSVSLFSNHSFGKVTLGPRLGEKIRQVLDEEKFDLLHIHSPLMMTLPILFQKYTNTVTVGTFHTYFDSIFFYRLLRKGLQRYLDKLDGRIAVAPSCVEAMDRYFQADYTIIPNGVATTWFANPPKIKKFEEGANILFLGRLDPRNGLDHLLDAFPHVARRMPEAKLIVVGDGPMRHFYEEKAAPFVGRKIFFEGQINGHRPEYLAASRVFCYPATKASFGITILEAMAAGVPVVATDNRGFRDIVRDGENGLLIPPDRPTALAGALVSLLQNRSLAGKLAVEGRKTAELCSWPRVTDRILDFYNRVWFGKKGMPFVS